jgi:hypothetical protein
VADRWSAFVPGPGVFESTNREFSEGFFQVCEELTRIYGGSARPALPDPQSQAERRRSPSAPQVSQFLEFVGEGIVLAVYAVAGRTVLRLRLSPVSRGVGQPILLNLHRRRQDCQTEDGPRHSAIDPA